MKDFIPNISELVDTPEDLDEKQVIENFLGLTQKEAQEMIASQNPFSFDVYTENLMWMSAKGFSYYLPSFIGACKVVHAHEDADGVGELCMGMLCSIAAHARSHPQCFVDNKKTIIDFLNFVEEKSADILKEPIYDEWFLLIKKMLKNRDI